MKGIDLKVKIVVINNVDSFGDDNFQIMVFLLDIDCMSIENIMKNMNVFDMDGSISNYHIQLDSFTVVSKHTVEIISNVEVVRNIKNFVKTVEVGKDVNMTIMVRIIIKDVSEGEGD